MIKKIIILFLLLLTPSSIFATSYNCGDDGNCDSAEMQALVTAASVGDTINITAAESTMSTQVSITKELIIQGQGSGSTTILNGVTSQYTAMFHCSISDTAASLRITALNFRPGTSDNRPYHILISGDSEFRIDHNSFTNASSGDIANAIRVSGYGTYGVIDNNTFDNAANEVINVKASNTTWTENPEYGNANAVYVETNSFDGYGLHALTSIFGAKTVFRYNTVRGMDIDVHGHCFESGHQSARHYEIYSNKLYSDGDWIFGMNIRGGTGVIYDNELYDDGGGFFTEIKLTDYRMTESGCIDGCCPGGEGYPCYDQIGRGKDQGSEPLYLWNNQIDTNGDDVLDRAVVVSPGKATAEECGSVDIADYIANTNHGGEDNPDYYDDETEMPAYTPYTYPHPLTGADETAPTILSVNSDKANGTYGVDEVIDIDVYFSEVVTSDGNVTVTLETGDTDRTCTFTVTAASSGTCNYTVQDGDISADLTVKTIAGTIADAASNAMSNFTPTVNLAVNKDIVIQTDIGPIPPGGFSAGVCTGVIQ